MAPLAAVTRRKGLVLTHPEPRKRSPRYLPKGGTRDRILIRTAPGLTTEAYHQEATLGLVEAQQMAEAAEGELELEVIRQPLVGAGKPAVLYRVVRDEDGAVLTHTVDLED